MKKILFVYAKGGAPLEHALPRIAACGEVHVLALFPVPGTAAEVWHPHCAGITEAWDGCLQGDALIELIVENARRIGAEAIFTLSEFAVIAVAEASERLGLRGAGSNVSRSRDKRQMRAVWEKAGVPIPRFRPVANQDELREAFRELTPPLLLKAAWGAGSIGQLVLRGEADVPAAWEQTRRAMGSARTAGYVELHDSAGGEDFLIEEIIVGSTRTWYETPGYGDYLSVEGIVADGVYHPIAITARIPTIEPFTELSNNCPCVLPEPLQRRIEQVARNAVDSLGLDYCGTHTEIKLADSGEMFVIESAARFGGVMVTKEIETVHGIDMIQLLVRELLGERGDYPERMLTEGTRAAASLALISTDAEGNPWQQHPVWDSEAVDWTKILSPGSTIEAVAGLTIPDGTPMPPYDLAGGAINWAGIFFLQADNADKLLRDCHAVLNTLEATLVEASLRRDSTGTPGED